MIFADLSPLANHLWQSTLCTAVAWLLTFVLRKNRAAVRYWIWLAASAKFLIPFSLLVNAGSHYAWRAFPAIRQPRFSFVMDEIGRPFGLQAPAARLAGAAGVPDRFPEILLFGVWLCGFTVGVICWLRWWQRIRAVQHTATPLHLNLPIPVMSSSARLEPGVFGIRHPVLLLPEGIADRLTPPQLEAVLAHELCHVRRRDNLTAAIHMVVEAIFWFHPLVWWIRARLVEERERACDEEVLRVVGAPEVYAQGILNVCRFYLELPLVCASGVTGSDLKRRIEAIVANRLAARLNFSRRLLLAMAAIGIVAGPVALGVLSAPAGRAQSQAGGGPRLEFEVASVKLNKTGARGSSAYPSPGGQRFTATNAPLIMLVMLAYNVTQRQIAGIPNSFNAEGYDIEAKADRSVSYQQLMRMLQTLLADRFKLTLHRETKELPVYALVVAKGGPKLRENPDPGDPLITRGARAGEQIFQNCPMPRFAFILSVQVDRSVEDRTGLKGNYDFTLAYTRDRVGPGVLEGREAPPDSDVPSIFTALQEQLGLRLESAKGPVDFLVIDHVERPSGN